MINWDLIIKDFNLKGRYGYFSVFSSSGRFIDLVSYHYDHFDNESYCPTLDSYSFVSLFYVVKVLKLNRHIDNFHCVIVLSRITFFTRFLKLSKYNLDVHK